jgi:hypothetical protein
LEPSVSCGDNIIGVGIPGEGLGACGIIFADEAIDGGLEIDDGIEDAIP